MAVMGEVLSYRPRHAREETTALIGMVVSLASWAMMFGAVFLLLLGLRLRTPMWPPPGTPTPEGWLLWLNTAVIAASSVIYEAGLRQLRVGAIRWSRVAIPVTMLLGLAFLGLQTLLWSQLHADGLRPTSGGTYGSVLYGFTGLHAVHVGIGLAGLGYVLHRVWAGTYGAARHLPVRLWGLYWHFVGVIWALMFVFVFLT